MDVEASKLAALANLSDHMPGKMALDLLKKHMMQVAPIIGWPTNYNTKTRRNKKRKFTLKELAQSRTPFPTLVIPLGKNRSVNHAFTVVDDLIFDSSIPYALKCNMASFGWSCNSGEKGAAGIHAAFRLENPNGVPKMNRHTVTNWVEK